MSSQIRVVVSLATGLVATGLTKIKAQFANLRHDLSSHLGSFLAVGGLVAGLEKLIQKGTEISNISRRFGAPAQELQRVANAGRENGAQIEDVARSWNKLTVNQQKAIHGNEEMRKAFEKLGISMKDVAGMTVDQLFYRVADATATTSDRGAAYAAVVQLMGRNAGLLYSTLEKGSGAIKAQGDEIGVMADETVERLHKMHIAIERLKQTLFIYGGGMLTFFAKIIESIGVIVGEITNEVELMINVFTTAGEITKNFFSGLTKGKFQVDTRPFVAAIEDVKKNAGALGKILSGVWAKHEEGSHTKHAAVDVELEPTGSETSKAEKLATLREQLAELERKSGNDQLATQEKINALIAQRAALLKEAAGEKDEEKKLQLQVDAAKVGQELVNAQQAATKEVEAAQDRLNKVMADSQYAALKTDDERKQFLLAQIDRLQKLIDAEGDAAEKLDLKTKQTEEKAKLAELVKKSEVVVTIAANSLRRIGGQEQGGFAAVGAGDKLLRETVSQTEILKDIKQNTKDAARGLIMR